MARLLSMKRNIKELLLVVGDLKLIYHWSTYLTSWSWQKLYGDRKTGLGYKNNKGQGRG